MLVALSLCWGLTWPAMRVGLNEVPPFSMRVVTLGLGAAALLIVSAWQGRSFAFGTWKNCLHLTVSGILSVLSFSLLSAIAMMYAATGRVAILSYTMPIWAALLAWLVLGERFTMALVAALALCAAGMAILIYPLAQHGVVPIGLLLALGIAVSWAIGTIYVKWARITGDPIVNAGYQVAVAFIVVLVCLPSVEGTLQVSQASALAVFSMVFAGLVGSGLAYFLWFGVIRRVSAMTASLGVLSAPVIGIISTAILLGERPTIPDIVGYVLIFAASISVLLPARR
jgi:drug/metabolite transporter (DMT)-like permease